MSSDPMLASQPAGIVDMTVGYTDPIIGAATWPLTTLAWSIQGPAAGQAGARVTVRLTLQPGGLIPAGVAPGNALNATAADISGRFSAAWYQVMQPDISAVLTTSLHQPAQQPPVPLPVPVDGLRAYLSASYAFARAASTLQTVMAEPATTPSLGSVVRHFGLDWQALGQACGERLLGSLVQLPAEGLPIPVFGVFASGDCVATLVPDGLDPSTVLLDVDNTCLPLNPGVELGVPSTPQAQPSNGLSLTSLAQALNITPASLVNANRLTPGLLAPGFIFAAQGVEVQVPQPSEPGADASLEDIARAYKDNGVPFDAIMAAVASGTTPGMFRAGVSLQVDRQITATGWSLDHNPTGIDRSTLANLNTATVDLFAAGTPLFLSASVVSGLDQAPLAATARAFGLEPADLLRHNAGLAPLPATADSERGVPIPGLAHLPAGISNPYRIRAGQSLTQIASLFASVGTGGPQADEVALAVANQAMPGTLVAAQTVVVDGQSLVTVSGDSFNRLIARATPPVSIESFAQAIADNRTLLAGGALLLCPRAQLENAGTGISPDALSERYGLSATLILSANQATDGLLLPGIVLAPSPTAALPTVTTAAADSFNAVIRRFAMAGVSVTLADIVQANHDKVMLAPGCHLLMPPADTVLQAAFGGDGWQFPDVIFPLRTWLTLSRDSARVDPAFRGSATLPSAVERTDSAIAVERNTAPDAQENGAATLSVFAQRLETTLVGLKLATGRVLSATRDPSPTDVWAVSFMPATGIGTITIGPNATVAGVDGLQPWSFALKPLSNTLEARSAVPIRSLDPVTGGWGTTQYNDYQGIDLEVWANAWLAGLDQLCTAAYATPAYRVAASALERLLNAKKSLACAVADGLSPILADQADTRGSGPGWMAARDVLYERLLNQLASAYDTTAIIQFNVQVTAPAGAATARLSGVGRLAALSDQRHAARLAAGDDPMAWKVAQLGNAKTRLVASTDGTLSFALNVSQPARHRAVELEPTYVVNEIEFDITPVVGGYDASNWLSFVRAFDQFPPQAFSAQLGAPVVPVPLRAYPEPAALISQTAQTPREPDSVDTALHWDYVFTYTHQSASQDQTLLEVEFNHIALANTRAVEQDSLFDALAQYAAISEGLWHILADLQGVDTLPSGTRLATALQTYADLAERITLLWSSWWGVGTCNPNAARQGLVHPVETGLVPVARTAQGQARLRAANDDTTPATAGAPHEFYHYLSTLDTEMTAGVEVYDTLTLRRLLADGAVGWPQIAVIGDDGSQLTLTPDGASGDTQVYQFPNGLGARRVPAFSRLVLEYRLTHLHIARYQNANAAVSVIRNAQLLGREGPATYPAFIYRTPPLSFPEPLVPLLTINNRLALGTWTQNAASNPLTPLFAQIFDSDLSAREVAISLRYGYSLVPGLVPIETFLPVSLQPRFTYNATSTVQSIIDAAAAWAQQASPVSVGGLWGLGIVMYSTTDPALDRPLLDLQYIVSPIA